MLKLSFDELPHYLFSDNRQFLPEERHIDRLCGEDVLLLVRKGVLRFHEDGVLAELHAGEYYIQRAGLYQQGLRPATRRIIFLCIFTVFLKKTADFLSEAPSTTNPCGHPASPETFGNRIPQTLNTKKIFMRFCPSSPNNSTTKR